MTTHTRLYSCIIIGLLVFSATQTFNLYLAEKNLEEMTTRAKTAEASVSALQSEKDSLTAALELQSAQLDVIRTERNSANAKLKTLQRNDPASGNWLSTPVPPSLLGVFK